MHISSFVCTSQTHVRIYYHADITYITVYCVSHTHTHTNANTHTHTHTLTASVYRLCIRVSHTRSARLHARQTAVHLRSCASPPPAPPCWIPGGPATVFFLSAHTHTHAHTHRLQNSMQTRCKFHASQNAYVLHVHACNKRHWTRTKNVYHDMNTCANIGHT